MAININNNVLEPELQRTYEISLWTLQDSFIAVLADSTSYTRGYIEDPMMQLSNDGTQELDFSLPMYIDDGINRVRSQIWSQMTNAVTIAGMRKIKVIFNKGVTIANGADIDAERVYEFIITKVTDTHEANRPMCAIHCEGLAFQELGKLGYKLDLSREAFELDAETKWQSVDEFENSGVNIDDLTISATIDYWNEKIGLTPYPANEILDSSIWYYRIQMDWSAYELSHKRSPNKVYEESYIASYDENLNAQEYEEYKEKWRYPTISESNIYNITQEIAKEFGVYCRYDYLYDENYHITGRIVTYYNNFINEDKRLEFTYPYTSKQITRENDCTDLVTKMYVNTFESSQSETGLVTIMDNPVNPTGEDYLLNFDYLYSIGTITDEQYKGIRDFSVAVSEINKEIIKAQEIIIKQETIDNIYSAQLQVLENALVEEAGLLDDYDELRREITNNNKTGVLTRSGSQMELLSIIGGKITFRDEGVIAGTVRLYNSDLVNNYNSPESESKVPFTYITENTEGQFVTTVQVNVTAYKQAKNIDLTTVYAAYQYYPKLYYDEVITSYKKKINQDETARDALQNKVNKLQTEIANAQNTLEQELEKKAQLIKGFEALMGPALREGNWTPEDYSNIANSTYQFINYIVTDASAYNQNDGTITIDSNPSGPPARLIWDTKLDYNEMNLTYLDGNEEKYYYILPLSPKMLRAIKSFYSNSENDGIPFGLVWYDSNYESSQIGNGTYDYMRPSPVVKFLAIGSGCTCAFAKNNDEIKPILILQDIVDASMLTSINSNSTIYLCGLTTEENNGSFIFKLIHPLTILDQQGQKQDDPITLPLTERINNEDIIYNIKTANQNYVSCQLRFRINDFTLFTDSQNLRLKYDNTEMNNYEDYSVLPIVNVESEEIGKGYDITIKPEFVIKHWDKNILQINYNCSQISTMVYLDAIEILKENAYPKVTYSIEPNLIYKDFFYTDYNALNKIAFINDNELDFNQVQGYISAVSLNLNKPWEDTIEVKNYKNKFEDIFSTIVAQTEGMQKNEAAISTIGNAVNMDGTLSQVNLSLTIPKIDLKYNMNNGTLNLNKTDGLMGTCSEGTVLMKADGIFYNSNNQRVAAITPRGINAEAITYGTLTLINANLGNGALVVKDGAFNLASNKLNLNSEDCTFNLSGTHMTLKSNDGIFILDGAKIDMNSNTGTFEFDGAALNLNSSTGITTIHKVSDINKGNITIGNGILQSSSITQNNGEDVATLGISLQDGLLSITSKNNLKIGNQNIEDYIKSNSRTVVQTWWGELSNIPISSINVGQTSASRGVFITENTFRLGRRARMNDGNEPEFLYENENGSTHIIRCLKLGSILQYSNFTSETSSFVGWALDGTNHSLTYTNNSVEISKISPTEFNFNNYLKIDSNGIKITDLALEKTSEHIITFKNNELNTDDYKLKITNEGLFYSLDSGTTWNQVAIITPEPTPDPTPEQEEEPEQEP